MLCDAYEFLEDEIRLKNSMGPSLHMFEDFGYLSDRIPSHHRAALAALAHDIATKQARTVVVLGHAFGSTMDRKYDLGFRRAMRVSAKLRQLIQPFQGQLAQFPRFVVASVGDTAPRIGKTPAQDRRVAVVFRPGR